MTESMKDIRFDDDLSDESLDRVGPSRICPCSRGEARICVVAYCCA